VNQSNLVRENLSLIAENSLVFLKMLKQNKVVSLLNLDGYYSNQEQSIYKTQFLF